MTELLLFLLTIVASTLFGTISSFTGGGGGLLGIPYFLAIGLPPVTAIGTGKFGGLAVTAASIPKYLKANKLDKDLAIKLVPVTLVASILGPQITFALDGDNLKVLIGCIILLMAPLMLLNKKKVAAHKMPKGIKLYAAILLYGVFATIQAAFGSGTGTLLILVLVLIFGLPYIDAGATRRLAGIPLVTVTVFLFALNGNVDYIQAIATVIGNYIGGRIGSQFALDKGNEWVKYALFVVLIIIGLRLTLS